MEKWRPFRWRDRVVQTLAGCVPHPHGPVVAAGDDHGAALDLPERHRTYPVGVAAQGKVRGFQPPRSPWRGPRQRQLSSCDGVGESGCSGAPGRELKVGGSLLNRRGPQPSGDAPIRRPSPLRLADQGCPPPPPACHRTIGGHRLGGPDAAPIGRRGTRGPILRAWTRAGPDSPQRTPPRRPDTNVTDMRSTGPNRDEPGRKSGAAVDNISSPLDAVLQICSR
jgi:hypothetical protein